MPAIKARRPGRHGQPQSKRRRSASSSIEGMPRLTAIQTAWQGESKPMTIRSMAMGMAGAVSVLRRRDCRRDMDRRLAVRCE